MQILGLDQKIKALDANKNGYISRAEYEKLEIGMFEAEQLKSAIEQKIGQPLNLSLPSDIANKLFEVLDTNQDGYIHLNELNNI